METAYDFDKALEISKLAGKIMLYAGAETYRVEDTIIRVASACGMEADSYVTPTGFFITLHREKETESAIVRIKYRTIDLNKVSLVNGVSRDLSTGRINPDQALERLKEIANLPSEYSQSFINISAGVASGGFAYLFGGNLFDVMAASLAGTLVNIAVNFFTKRQAVIFLATFLAALVAGSTAVLSITIGLGTQLDKIIIGAIMPLLPGVVLTNAVRDMIAGDLVSGVARLAEALLIASAIAAGIIVILSMVI
ncbi:hypothetical protein BHU72_11160 [Desulfuribacillus stibiiarsenatis]|uniref:Threonine/serine exporter-like N-terminal domain-containing protein n=1 Tax=Desulfuribacillus stibiiarsenatis TaxID=1390249 RepID=A0A1E5L2I8_9FIRM|nr:threonine/serine exporter family protein [Desulfuribacillus stibiiarsenatis]OEH84355.1 hypothetical protein BHU72_11160 [Desulfuribacillus stibiiarsenatis]